MNHNEYVKLQVQVLSSLLTHPQNCGVQNDIIVNEAKIYVDEVLRQNNMLTPDEFVKKKNTETEQMLNRKVSF